jgi:hypothetical protein
VLLLRAKAAEMSLIPNGFFSLAKSSSMPKHLSRAGTLFNSAFIIFRQKYSLSDTVVLNMKQHHRHVKEKMSPHEMKFPNVKKAM